MKILEGVEEYQSLSLYHEIIREAPDRLPAPTSEEQQAFIDEMAAKVETSTDFTAARKRSLQNRLANARDGHVAPDIFYASKRIEERARLAKVSLDDYYNRAARDLGESVGQIRTRLSASYEESKRERSMAAPEEWLTEYRRRPGNAGLPLDRHTAYAMWRIDNEIAERHSVVESRPTVTNHERVRGTGLSAIGYDPATGRLEVEFRSRQGQFYAYRDVPADVHAQIMASDTPTATFNALVRNNRSANYAYSTQAASDAAAVQHRCSTCGQFAGDNHGCPARGSAEEIAATTERARIQQQVMRARRMVASGTEQQRLNGYLLAGDNMETAQARIERENELAQMSPDTTMRHRQNQRLAARIHPYRGESGTFNCTALSTVRRIAGEEPQVNVPVTARINRVYDELSGQPVDVPMGTVTGRVLVRSEGAGYSVTPATTPGDSGQDQLRCTCLDYRRNYDCVHVRQLVGDMNRRINQDFLRQRHAITDAVAVVNEQARADYDASLAAEASAQERWITGGDGVAYRGEDGAAAFQEDYAAAKARQEAGEDPIGFMTENATDGLGARGTGRSFGTELEFSFPDGMSYEERAEALQRIGIELYEAGLTPVEYQEDYGTRKQRGYTESHMQGWSFEEDGSVDGEIISPIMYDEPEAWENLQKVCDILRRNGANANAKTGSHVHIGTGNYDHRVENQNRLLGMFHEHEDEVYRLASSPERGTHRSAGYNSYANPNPRRATGYRNVRDAAAQNRGYYAINLEDTALGSRTDHAEFRVWDGTLNPSVIQSQIKMSLAMTEAAFRDTDYTPSGHTPFGSTRQRHRDEHGATRRLTGEDWRASTEGVRTLADRLYRRREDKAQLAGLFAATKWQRRNH